MKTVELYGKYLDRFLTMDPFGLSCVIGLRGSFALGCTMEQEDDSDRPAGLVIVSEDDDRLVIDWLYVIPEYRGEGLGSYLMELVFEEAVKRGMSSVAARISDEFDEAGLLWDTDSFFVNDVFKSYEDMYSEIRFTVKDISKLLRAEEALNEKAAGDPSVFSLSKVPKKDKAKLIKSIDKAFSSQLFADAEDLFEAADKDMSFVRVKGGEIRGALFIRKSADVWFIYSLVAKEDADAERLIRTAMYYSEDYTKVKERICIQPQRNSSIALIDKFGIKYTSYGIHFISAPVADYLKFKKMIEAEE